MRKPRLASPGDRARNGHAIGPGGCKCQVRQAGFEPATRCLEGSCSVRLSYGRSEIIVPGEYHASATCRSQCVAALTPADSQVYEQAVGRDHFAGLSRTARRGRTTASAARANRTTQADAEACPAVAGGFQATAGHGGPSRRTLRSATPDCLPLGCWSSRRHRYAATIASTSPRHSPTRFWSASR